jgi:CubicO group peptidase (beta-lactamase class C family)
MSSRCHAWLLSSLPFAVMASAAAQRPTWQLTPGSYVVRHVDVLTMEQPSLLRDRDVRVHDGIITAITAAAATPADAHDTAIDGRGLTLLPGLMDMHVHLTDTESEQQLVLYPAHGVTTVQSMNGGQRQLEVRARLARGELLGPRFLTTGPTTAEVQVNSPEKALRVVDSQVAMGFDAIKMYGDGSDTMTRATYSALIKAAHARGVRVVGHAPRNLPFEVVLAEGQDSIDHMEEILYTSTPILKVMAPLIRFQFGNKNRDEVDKVLARGKALDAEIEQAAVAVAADVKAAKLAITPTLIAFTTIRKHVTPEFDALGDNPLLRCMSPLTARAWEPANNTYCRAWAGKHEVMAAILGRGLAVQKALVTAFRAAGVPLLTGTDAPLTFVYPGWSLHRELEIFVACGLSPYEALTAATTAPAAVLGLADVIGTVTVGKQADLLLVHGDPTADIGNSSKVAGVFVRGRWLDRAAIDAQIEALAASYAPLATQLPPLQRAVAAGDYDAAVAAFKALSPAHPLVTKYIEDSINQQGYRRLNDKAFDAAIALFRRNCALFPDSSNAFDSFGEAWLTMGDKAQAIANYRRSVELYPGNINAVLLLEQLQPPAADAVTAALADHVARLAVFGFSGQVLVADHGRVLLDRAVGLAADGDRPVTASTVFNVASFTKQFTAAAVLRLEMDGKLKVSDAVDAHLAGLPSAWHPITIHHLLTHTAGLPRDVVRRGERTLLREQVVQAIVTAQLRGKPGEQFAYSNAGYQLLAAIVEVASGETFGDYLRRHLFAPAAMADSGTCDQLRWQHAAVANGCDEWHTLGSFLAWPKSWELLGAGGAVSTAGDLHRWQTALAGESILSAAAKGKMFARQVAAEDNQGYGYGCFVATGKDQQPLLFHGGDNAGYHSEVRWYPRDERLVVVLTNRDRLGIDGGAVEKRVVADALVAILDGKEHASPPAAKACSTSIPGDYTFAGGTARVWTTAGRTVIGVSGQAAIDRLLGGGDVAARSEANRKTEQVLAAIVDGRVSDASTVLSADEIRIYAKFLAEEVAEAAGKLGACRGNDLLGTVPLPWDSRQLRSYVRVQFERGTLDLFLGWNAGTLNDVTTGDERPFALILPLAQVGAEELATYDPITSRSCRIGCKVDAGRVVRLAIGDLAATAAAGK